MLNRGGMRRPTRLMRALAACSVLVWAALLHCASAAERTYYVQAEEVDWDYVPTGFNLVQCLPLEYDAMAVPFTSVCAPDPVICNLVAAHLDH